MAVAAAVGLAVVRYDELRHVERIDRDLAAITPCVERGKTIVQGSLARVQFGSLGRVRPLAAEAGRIAAARNGLDLGNIDWAVPQSLQRYRSESNPYEHLVAPRAFVEDVPPPFDFSGFERTTGRAVDDVLLYAAMTEKTRRSAAWRRFEKSLHRRCHRVARSPLGWWEIWAKAGRSCRLRSGRGS